MLKDSMRVKSVESSKAEYTDDSTEWKHDDTLLHDLLVPHPDDRQHVTLYDRVSGNNNLTSKKDIGGRAFTGAKHDQRTWEPVDMMRHPTYAKSDPADKSGSSSSSWNSRRAILPISTEMP